VNPTLEVAANKESAMVRCANCDFSFQFIASPPPDVLLHDGEIVNVGKMSFRVIHTPGHSPGQVCLYSEEEKVIFTGDTLFQGSIGRTDLPGSCEADMATSLLKLAQMPDDVEVCPGHGEPTKMDFEKRFNPFLRTDPTRTP
jgi:glyoxylase-like metal-dependent hydrolase (beta-lactamase superfamily II)